jgi:hypothetical protein
METVQEHFQVEFPSGRSISPFTKGDWEGSGVLPDMAVPVEQALKVAHLHALDWLIQACTDEQHKQRKQELIWDLEIARNTYVPISVSESVLARYPGDYGDRSFRLTDGVLTYSRQRSPVIKLIPLAENRFLLPDWAKCEFCLDEQGRAVSVTISYRDGQPAITFAQ